MAGKQLKQAVPEAVRSRKTVGFYFSALVLFTVHSVKEEGEKYTTRFDSVQHNFSELVFAGQQAYLFLNDLRYK